MSLRNFFLTMPLFAGVIHGAYAGPFPIESSLEALDQGFWANPFMLVFNPLMVKKFVYGLIG